MAAVAAGLGVGSFLMQMNAQSQNEELQRNAAKESLAMGDYNAKQVRMQTAEEAYMLSMRHEQTYGAAVARSAASGVLLQGSTALYLDDMRTKMDEEMDWLKRTGKRNEEMELMNARYAAATGNAAATASRAQMFGGIMSGAANIYGLGAQANWWS